MALVPSQSGARSLGMQKTLLGSALALLMAPAFALNLQQAYEAAMVHDANIKASRATAEATKERLPQAKAQLLPSVSLSAARNHNDLTTRTQNYGQPVTLENRYYSGNQSLSVRQPLYRPYQTALLEQAKAMVEDAEAVLEHDEHGLLVRVAEAYFDALLAQDQVQLIAAQKQSNFAQLDAAQKSFVAGSGTRTDVDEAQARVDMSLAQELEARQNQDITRRRLEVLVGQPVDMLSGIAVSAFEPAAPQPPRLEDWIAQAEAASPELTALRAQMEAARLEIDKAQSGHKPTLDLVAQWSRSNSDSVTNINSRYDQKAVGLQLSVPIYSGGYVSSTVRQAVANHTQAREKLEAARLELTVRVHQEFRAVTEGVLKIAALEQAVRSAEQAVISNHKSFEAGSRTTLDVLNAEQQKTSALRDLAQARYMYVLARLRLHVLAGTDRAVSLQQAAQALLP